MSSSLNFVTSQKLISIVLQVVSRRKPKKKMKLSTNYFSTLLTLLEVEKDISKYEAVYE